MMISELVLKFAAIAAYHSLTFESHSANLPIILNYGSMSSPILVIDKGDSLTWQNQIQGTNSITSLTTAWTNDAVLPPGGNFTTVLSTPGFYPFVTSTSGYGAIHVIDWNTNPPAVTVNWPVDSFAFGGAVYDIEIDATVRIQQTNIVEVDALINGNVIGTSSNAPFSFHWTQSGSTIPQGAYVIQVLVHDIQGTINYSNAIRIQVGDGRPTLCLPRRLENGRFLCYYSLDTAFGGYIAYYGGLPLTRKEGFYQKLLRGDGVFVDATATNALMQRFYVFGEGQTPPP
jgi:hypothetical protein